MKTRFLLLATRTVAAFSFAVMMFGCGTQSTFATRSAVPEAAKANRSLAFVDMAGSSHSLRKIAATGRKSVLVFWQTWCIPCRREGPVLAAAAREHRDSLAFFGIVSGPDGVVNDQKVLSVAGSMGLQYPQIRDRDASLAKRFAIESTPTILVLGDGGRVLYRGHHVPKDWNLLR